MLLGAGAESAAWLIAKEPAGNFFSKAEKMEMCCGSAKMESMFSIKKKKRRKKCHHSLLHIAKSTVLPHQQQIIQALKYLVGDKIFRQVLLH